MQVQVQLSLPRDANVLPLTRSITGRVLSDFAVPDADAEDVQLALTEACANVIKHARGSNDYRVRLTVDPLGCEVEVVDSGPGFDSAAQAVSVREAPPVLAEAGRGLFLMQALVDEFRFFRDDSSTHVRLSKRWTQPPLAAQAGATASG